jgi:hypothetical protein
MTSSLGFQRWNEREGKSWATVPREGHIIQFCPCKSIAHGKLNKVLELKMSNTSHCGGTLIVHEHSRELKHVN